MLEWKEIPLKFYFMHYMYEIERYLFYGSLSWESNQYFYQFAECLNIENILDARLFHFKYWSVCTVRTMFRTLSWFFAALLFSVHCLQRQFWYSRLYKEVTNSSLAILYGEDCSLVHCAGLCSGDDYCMEFLYSEISRHCIGLHCVKKDNYLYQYMGPESSHMLRYEKGNLSCLNKNTFRW